MKKTITKELLKMHLDKLSKESNRHLKIAEKDKDENGRAYFSGYLACLGYFYGLHKYA